MLQPCFSLKQEARCLSMTGHGWLWASTGSEGPQAEWREGRGHEGGWASRQEPCLFPHLTPCPASTASSLRGGAGIQFTGPRGGNTE